MQMDTQYLKTGDSDQLAYQHSPPAADQPATAPGLVFLAGHGSDMLGTKAEILAQWAIGKGIGFTRFDYRGHGQSSGRFLDLAISDWTDDACQIIGQVTSGPQILIGSSLGGWIMLNLLKYCPDRIAGLIGIAAAPDFTERLIWSRLDPGQQAEMIASGQLALPNPYAEGEFVVYPHKLIEDGRRNLLLDKPLAFDGPVILHQGMQDGEVPWQTALDIAGCLTSEQTEIILDKHAGHRYSGPAQLDALISSAARLCHQLATGQPAS